MLAVGSAVLERLEDERLASGYELLQRLRRLIARRSVPDLDQWLEDAVASELVRLSASHTAFSRTCRGCQRTVAALVDRTRRRHSDKGEVDQTPGLRAGIHPPLEKGYHQRSLTPTLGERCSTATRHRFTGIAGESVRRYRTQASVHQCQNASIGGLRVAVSR